MGYRECVRTIRDKWHFGKRWRTKDISGKFNGFSAPLWVNSAPNHFLFLSIWGACFFVGCLLAYILYISNQTECTFNMKPIVVAQISVVGFNSKEISAHFKKNEIFIKPLWTFDIISSHRHLMRNGHVICFISRSSSL